MMKKTITDNLTFEQFKALADRPPSLEDNRMYRLIHEILRDQYEYPEFMKNITEERVNKIKEIWNKMHGRLVPGFRWSNHPFTPYYYDDVNDSFNCMDVNIPIDIPIEEITHPKLFFLIKD